MAGLDGSGGFGLELPHIRQGLEPAAHGHDLGIDARRAHGITSDLAFFRQEVNETQAVLAPERKKLLDLVIDDDVAALLVDFLGLVAAREDLLARRELVPVQPLVQVRFLKAFGVRDDGDRPAMSSQNLGRPHHAFDRPGAPEEVVSVFEEATLGFLVVLRQELRPPKFCQQGELLTNSLLSCERRRRDGQPGDFARKREERCWRIDDNAIQIKTKPGCHVMTNPSKGTCADCTR